MVNLTWPFAPPEGGFTPDNDYGPRVGGGVVSSNHMGVDFGISGGTPIPSAGDGVVVLAGVNGGYGNCVIIDHGDGIRTLYGHMRQINVSVGQRIVSRETLGLVGTTGNSTGNHLHFGVLKNGQYVDPVLYVKGVNISSLPPAQLPAILEGKPMFKLIHIVNENAVILWDFTPGVANRHHGHVSADPEPDYKRLTDLFGPPIKFDSELEFRTVRTEYRLDA